MYGCDKYPGGYEFVENFSQSTCDHGHAFGFSAVPILFFIGVVGAYILPTVLVGIVSIKFDIATKALVLMKSERKDFIRHLGEARAALPDFFTDERVEAIEELFEVLDAKREKQLDLNELSPFFHYTLDYLFEVEITSKQCEALFFLIDSNQATEVGLGEFISFIKILKEMQNKMKEDPNYASKIFNNVQMKKSPTTYGKDGKNKKSKWDAAMSRLDQESLDAAWDAIITSINGTQVKI